MYARNPWGTSDQSTTADELKKAIREQNILLSTLTPEDSSAQQTPTIEELKKRIVSLTQEQYDKQQMAASSGRSTTNASQWWQRYQLNLQQLQDIADQKQALIKEVDYLVGTSTNSLEEDLRIENDKLERVRQKSGQLRRAVSPSISHDYSHMTESERIRTKAQAMVAARLGRTQHSTLSHTTHAEDTKIDKVNQLLDSIKQTQRQVEHIMESDLSQVDNDLDEGTKEWKDRQMFGKGLYVDDELACFIEQLDRTLIKTSEKRIYTPPPFRSPSASIYTQGPPPIPTSQRPGTPRSEADIKAEAQRRIDERRKLFTKEKEPAVTVNRTEDNCKVSDEEKASQERMRQAEADARARLQTMRAKREALRKEAAEAEERKKRAAAEASAAAEAEMLAEKRQKQREEEERLAKIKKAQDQLAEQQRILREAELERLRLEREAKEAKEREERKLRDEKDRAAEEIRQQKARKAAEQAALEKRQRRMEIERREREIEAARLEEINRRKQWEEAENQKRLDEERRIREKEEEALRIRQRLEEEDAQAEEQRMKELEEARHLEEEAERLRKEEEERIRDEKKREEEAIREAERKLLEDRRLEELRQRKRKERELAAAKARKEADAIERAGQASKQTYATTPSIVYNNSNNSTTAGTSGYGVDVEDEVNFNIIYRVNTLYEYQGMREDDLSFLANEILKAHPSKDKGSDWWYGTSLATNQVGFFPRTYVEVKEEAFRVKTLYSFTKSRNDDLGFSENEVIIVQPFQDESSDWWYGTIEDTFESGYFPKSYVEKIDSASTNQYISPSSTSMSIPILGSSVQNNYHAGGGGMLTVPDQDMHRGLSAPNTPIMKKTTLSVDKAQVSKRRRAASSVSINNSHIGSPQPLFPRSGSVSENLELLTWASTMDELELDAIPADERKRQEAIFELISTEKSYLNDLQMIVNIFYTDSGKYLSQDERDVVFSNIDDLLMCNTALLSDLETRQRERANVVDNIGDVFLKHADSLQCYSTYCRNQSYATKFLQKKRESDQWFEVFLKTAQTRAECRSLDLSHFLLEPVQRITRYPLLLRQILNCTPDKHPDYALTRSALAIAQKVLEDVNEETRRFENIQKMSELSRILDMEGTNKLDVPGRDFVMESALFKAKSGRRLHGILFSDILILAEPLKSLNPKGYLYTLYREPMAIENVSVRQQQSMNLKPTFGHNAEDLMFQIVYGAQVIAVKTLSAAQKRQWMSQIQHFSALQQYN